MIFLGVQSFENWVSILAMYWYALVRLLMVCRLNLFSEGMRRVHLRFLLRLCLIRSHCWLEDWLRGIMLRLPHQLLQCLAWRYWIDSFFILMELTASVVKHSYCLTMSLYILSSTSRPWFRVLLGDSWILLLILTHKPFWMIILLVSVYLLKSAHLLSR